MWFCVVSYKFLDVSEGHNRVKRVLQGSKKEGVSHLKKSTPSLPDDELYPTKRRKFLPDYMASSPSESLPHEPEIKTNILHYAGGKIKLFSIITLSSAVVTICTVWNTKKLCSSGVVPLSQTVHNLYQCWDLCQLSRTYIKILLYLYVSATNFWPLSGSTYTVPLPLGKVYNWRFVMLFTMLVFSYRLKHILQII